MLASVCISANPSQSPITQPPTYFQQTPEKIRISSIRIATTAVVLCFRIAS